VQKVKVRIPATITSVGAGVHAIGLALSMHTHVALQVRSDTHLSVTVTGDAADKIPSTIDNLALRAAIRVFQRIENAPVGLHVEVHNSTPFGVGLGEQTALVVGGLVAAHNLIDSALTRDDMIRIALSFNLPYEGIVAALLGGISLCSLTPEEPFTFAYASLEVPPTRAIIIVPEIPNLDATPVRFPQTLLLTDAVRMMRQSLVFTEAIRNADYDLLKRTLAYQPHQAEYAKIIPHLAEVQKAALDEGGAGTMISSNGQMLIAFAQHEPHAVAEAMVAVFEAHQMKAQHWVLPLDRQGVVISEIEELNP
jgi:homoserine kinase